MFAILQILEPIKGKIELDEMSEDEGSSEGENSLFYQGSNSIALKKGTKKGPKKGPKVHLLQAYV